MKFVAICASALALGLLALAPAQAKPTGLYVFGDSLVDAGNLDAAVGSDVFNPAALGYFPGRFTNGPVYTDLLSKALTGAYMTPSLLGGDNYGFADARAVELGAPVPALDLQLGAYFADHAGVADPNALFILNIGGNDTFGLEDGDIGPYTPAAYAALVTSSILDAVQALDAAGARNILVAGNPVFDPQGAALDADLQSALDAFEPTFAGHLLRLDYQSLFPALVGNPGAFGLPDFIDTSTPCMNMRPVIGGKVDCRGYLFFDDTHPTAEVQGAIFRQVEQLTGVPEPATWTLLIAGFGLTGVTLRRRRMALA
ncbi:SGNH/GDSL hydrolase family protein [Phenylobacterium sp.]|uniref:SGNH/GDSL hydrolase family protein n=1 Tax=Phenylobacterium sp. TaxID=1871053 RepID=UPI0025DD8F6B|nr:SGNH/GDSL hydrolase family protein [Phenylobacterium sp.]